MDEKGKARLCRGVPGTRGGHPLLEGQKTRNEELFRPHLLASIPEAKRPLYEKELIETQIGAVWTIALGSHYADLSKPSAFAAQLREDIRRTHYPADFPTKLLLRAPSAAVVRLTKLFIRLRIKAAAIAHRIRRS